MASYEEGMNQLTPGEVTAIIAGSGLSAETKAAVEELLTSLGTEDVALQSTTQTLTNLTADPDSTVILQTGNVSANVTFAPDDAVRVMTVGSGGDSQVVFQTSEDVVVQLSGGKGDSVSTGDGSDTITFTGGSATVNTGEGNDRVVLQGADGQATVVMGSGNGVIDIQGMTGAASIDAGDGFDQVTIQSVRTDHKFAFTNGKFTMNSDAELTMENVNIVTFDEDGNGVIDAITVLADTAGDAITAKLYQVALGRGGLDGADGTNGESGDAAVTGALGGIAYWTDVFEQGTNTGADLQHTVYSFLNCDEFHSKYDGMTDEQFVQALYNNLGNANDTTVSTINGQTAAEMAAGINGNMNARYDAAWTVAASDEAIQILGSNGINYVIDGFSGSDAPSA